MRIRMVIMTARTHDARIAAPPADCAGARCQLPCQLPDPAAAAAAAAG